MPTSQESNEIFDEGVKAERARCVAIVNAARFGNIDGDLRSIRSRIESGEDFHETTQNERRAANAKALHDNCGLPRVTG